MLAAKSNAIVPIGSFAPIKLETGRAHIFVCLCGGFPCTFVCFFWCILFFFVVLHWLLIFVAWGHEPDKVQILHIHPMCPPSNCRSQPLVPQNNLPRPKIRPTYPQTQTAPPQPPKTTFPRPITPIPSPPPNNPKRVHPTPKQLSNR